MLYILLAALACAADQLLKLWVKSAITFSPRGTLPLLPGVVRLTHVHNTGMAFSLFSSHTWVLAIVSVVAVAAMTWFLYKGGINKREKIALSFVIGGALGNAIDRIFQGYVVDMFETEFIDFAVFNLADVFIDVGAAVFLILFIAQTFREERKTGAVNDDDTDNGG